MEGGEASRSWVDVAEPAKAEKVVIGYAKRAKTVDIEALKEHVWAIINDMAGKAVPKSKAAGAAASEGELLPFQAVVDKLHERMPPAKLSELSISYCFYCVLDLANKKGLEIVAGEFGDLESLSVRLPAMAKGK